jgi:hypothetical protein
MGTLVRRGLEGDQVLAEWSAADADSYQAAAEVFEHEVEAGCTAIRSGDETREPVTSLPRDAELVILTSAMGGGP